MTQTTPPPAFPFNIVGFDLDGTLLDTAEDLRAALNHVLALAGRPPVPVEAARRMIGSGTRRLLEDALAHTGGGLDDDGLARLTAALVAYYEAHIAIHTRPFPGALAALDALAARGVRLAVVTNKPEHLAVKLLGTLGLEHRFFTILGGDSLGPGRAKPAPDLLHAMLELAGDGAVGTNGTRAAYVGDTSFDTRAARAAGMPCVLVRFGFCDAPPDSLGADAVIDHFDALPAVLAGLP